MAAPAAAHQTALSLAQQAAAKYWGSVPCAGNVTIQYAANPTTSTDPGPFLAVATWDSDVDGVYTGCVVTLNSHDLPPATQAKRFSLFCGLMVHEYGHFFGHEDEQGYPATSINNEYVGPANEHVAPCVSRYLDAWLLTNPVVSAPRVSDGPRVLAVGHERRSRHAGNKKLGR